MKLGVFIAMLAGLFEVFLGLWLFVAHEPPAQAALVAVGTAAGLLWVLSLLAALVFLMLLIAALAEPSRGVRIALWVLLLAVLAGMLAGRQGANEAYGATRPEAPAGHAARQ